MPVPRARRASAAVRMAVPVLGLVLALCLLSDVCFTGGRIAGAAPLRGALRRAEVREQIPESAGVAAGTFAGGPAAAFMGAGVVAVGSLLLRRRAAAAQRKGFFDPTREAGAMAPFGYWDPLGLMKQRIEGASDGYAWEWKDQSTFIQYRRAELKHGRLSMVALTGMIAAAFFRFPNEESQMSPDGLSAMSSEAAGGIGLIFLAAGYLEVQQGMNDYDDPADLRNKLDLGNDFDMYSMDLKNKELAHGRLAMSAVFSLWLCELWGGRTPSEYLKVQLSPPLVIVIFALLLLWSSGSEEQKMPVFDAPPSRAALPAAEKKEAPKLDEAPAAAPAAGVLKKTTVGGKPVFRFAAAS